MKICYLIFLILPLTMPAVADVQKYISAFCYHDGPLGAVEKCLIEAKELLQNTPCLLEGMTSAEDCIWDPPVESLPGIGNGDTITFPGKWFCPLKTQNCTDYNFKQETCPEGFYEINRSKNKEEVDSDSWISSRYCLSR